MSAKKKCKVVDLAQEETNNVELIKMGKFIDNMIEKEKNTELHRNFDNVLERLEFWTLNPWRRYSLLLIVLLACFFLGSSIGTINGVLALMDPIGAFFAVLILEFLVRLRKNNVFKQTESFAVRIIDSARIGLLYGLLLEGFKLL